MRSLISLVIIVSVFKGEGKLCRACPCLFLFLFAELMMKNKRRKDNKMKKMKKEKKNKKKMKK
jgi:hypothetical protein